MTRNLLACLAFLSFLSTAAPNAVGQSEDTLGCRSNPTMGRLCRQMENIADDFSYTCTGNACYAIWRRLIQGMDQFSYLYENYVPYGSAFDATTGALASKTTRLLCAQTATGDPNWVRALFDAKVQAKRYLVEIQKGAAIARLSDCRLTLR